MISIISILRRIIMINRPVVIIIILIWSGSRSTSLVMYANYYMGEGGCDNCPSPETQSPPNHIPVYAVPEETRHSAPRRCWYCSIGIAASHARTDAATAGPNARSDDRAPLRRGGPTSPEPEREPEARRVTLRALVAFGVGGEVIAGTRPWPRASNGRGRPPGCARGRRRRPMEALSELRRDHRDRRRTSSA